MKISRILKILFFSFLAGSLTLACYSIVNSFFVGAKNLNVLAELIFSPVFALTLHYDFLVLGKTKLLGSLVSFYAGFFAVGCVCLFKDRRKR